MTPRLKITGISSLSHYIQSMLAAMAAKRRFRELAVAAATTPIIENLEGRQLFSTFNVTSDQNAGAGTFREAIELANATPGPDRIAFNIGNGGFASITPDTPLPDIIDTLEIDGTTQPQSFGTPTIELSGDDLATGSGADGLRFVAGSQGSVIKGLFINRFDGFAVEINGTSNITVAGNNIGATVDGTGFFIKPQGVGIAVANSANNTIGGLNAGEGNLISGNGNGIIIDGAASTGNVLQGNFIGTTADGNGEIANVIDGVVIANNAASNVIGGSAAGAANLISGNGQRGVLLVNGVHDNLVHANRIGTSVDGDAAIANGFGGGGNTAGVLIADNADNNWLFGNLISGNKGPGVAIDDDSDHNDVTDNLIGTNVIGTSALPNAVGVKISDNSDQNSIGGIDNVTGGNVISGNTGDGVLIELGTQNLIFVNKIGTNSAGDVKLGNGGAGVHVVQSAATVIGQDRESGNLISGNAEHGILLDVGPNTIVRGNRIGTDAAGAAALGNGLNGVVLLSSDKTRIGGADAAHRNLISGNGAAGVLIGDESDENELQGNFIGTDVTGLLAIGNAVGVRLTGNADDNRLGDGSAAQGNLISGNTGDGMLLEGGTANLVLFNRIGTDVTGDGKLPNSGAGIHVNGAGGTFIGDAGGGSPNLISANALQGILVEHSPHTIIRGNRIGTNAVGTAALGNGTEGIKLDDGSLSEIGGKSPSQANLIAGNSADPNVRHDEILIANSDHLIVQGNLVGTDVTGTKDLASGNFAGIRLVQSSLNLIGGTTPGARNVVSGNDNGIFLDKSGQNVIQGNYVGTDITGTKPLSNIRGVEIFDRSDDNLIGGLEAGAGNLVSANTQFGVFIASASGNRVQGNRIGTDAAGSAPLGNLANVTIQNGSHNLVGGSLPAAGNIIAFATGDGVQVADATGNAIRLNSIFDNGGLGIRLSVGAGPLTNDPLDADTGGGNNKQNHPVLLSAITNGAATTITGLLNSTPSTQFIVDVYSNPSPDPLGQGEGKTYVGSFPVTTDANGNATFTGALQGVVPAGAVLSATATTVAISPFGDTSEFGPDVAVTAPPLPVVSIGDVTATEGKKGGKAFTFTVTLSAASSQTVTMKFATANGTATSASGDFDAKSGTLAFAPGETIKTITIYVKGDTKKEADETFFVNLSNVTNATFGDSQGIGTIKNDD